MTHKIRESLLSRKLQQYNIFKFSSTRLRKSKYNISLTIPESRGNAELVSLGDSQLLQSLREIKGLPDNQEQIDNLFLERKRIRNKKSSLINSKRLLEIEKEMDELLFVPEIISIVVEDNRHYVHIINKGLIINGNKFVRFLCSSGQARRNSVIFIDQKYQESMQRILQNGFLKDTEISPAKYNAYFSLCASAGLEVSNLRFAVVKDLIVERNEMVDMVIEDTIGDNDKIEKINKNIEFNLFDGQGLISPSAAQIWTDELELNYLPSSFVIRNSFLKGMVCVFDFHELAKEKGIRMIQDIWGNYVDISTIDLIISESQFKLWNNYRSIDDYIDNLRKNNLHWRISRVSSEFDKHHVFLNYQFLQVLDLDASQIQSLCKDTLEYFSKTIIGANGNVEYTLLYLLGKYVFGDYDANIFNKINDKITKALILNNNLIDDIYIQNHILHSLNKKIKESYIGNIIVDGNYSTMIADPYAMTEHVLGLAVSGLLQKSQSYSQYWNKKKIKKVVAMRAPLTWKSEVNVLDLTINKNINHWYKYIYSGIIYNIHGNDTMLHADSDFDGDLVMTTSSKEIVDTAGGGLPIYYETANIPKTILEENQLYLTDMVAFNSKVGFITNVSTTMYSMLPEYDIDSKEYNTIIERLKLCRQKQGQQIDKAKGLVVKKFPLRWTNWNKKESDMTDIEKTLIDFDNKILVYKRPYFMKYLYTKYNKKYKRFAENYNNFAIANFGITIDELLNKECVSKDLHEQSLINKHYRFSPLLDSDCTINQICHYMESNIKEIKLSTNKNTPDDIIRILKNPKIKFDKIKFKKLYAIYKVYKSGKRNFAMLRDDRGNILYKTSEQYNKYILQQSLTNVSSNISELANLAVNICYETHPGDNKNFVWNIFGDGIIKNVMLNKQSRHFIPFLGKGNLNYLGDKYYLGEIKIEREIEDGDYDDAGN